MPRLVQLLDNLLTGLLVVLVVLMVFSITAEIVLNAVVQPLASAWLERLTLEEAPAAGLGRTVWLLEAATGLVAKASAPVNTASQTLLVWVGILGSALAFRRRAHLGVDALVRVYPPRARLLLDCLASVLVGAFSLAVLLVGGVMVVRQAFERGSKMPGIEWLNYGWFYLVLPITGVLTLIYCVGHLCRPKPVGSDQPEQETA